MANSEKLAAWKISHIADELRESFSQCQTETEKSVWRVYVAKDCRRILGERKPTPGEQSILSEYGISID